MPSLTTEQRNLIFDFSMGQTGEERSVLARCLIESNQAAAEAYSRINSAMGRLDGISDQHCPDVLAESTLRRLIESARPRRTDLDRLLAYEQTAGGTRRIWRGAGELLATAAVILLVAGTIVGPLNMARQKSWQKKCQFQLGRIWQGITDYGTDHDGNQPRVAASAGSPWWKVGYTGQENHSNTRNMWLLVKEGYVGPEQFVCPGRSQGRAIQLSADRAMDYWDFPARRYVTYSFRIRCNKSGQGGAPARKVLIADVNPLFENLPSDYSATLNLHLTEALAKLNSGNHGGRGQSVLFCDGSVEFVKDRHIGITSDDMFTLRDTQIYHGTETPSCEADTFLAP